MTDDTLIIPKPSMELIKMAIFHNEDQHPYPQWQVDLICHTLDELHHNGEIDD